MFVFLEFFIPKVSMDAWMIKENFIVDFLLKPFFPFYTELNCLKTNFKQ